LLVARGVFQPDREYFWFDGDGPPQRVRLLKQLERTSAFEQVVFAAAAEPAANAD
jgi:hypothetical protein